MKDLCTRIHLLAGAATLLLSIDPSFATTRYHAVDLNRGEPYGTVVLAVDNGEASGFVIDRYSVGHEMRYCRRAIRWTSLSAPPNLLGVPGSFCSDVRGMSGAGEAGAAGNEYPRAMIWENGVVQVGALSTSAYVYSMANGIRGNTVAGEASGAPTGGHLHAVLWRIGKSSVIDLNGQFHLESSALATDGKEAAGWASDENGENTHAMLWSGSHHTAIDLNPEAFDSSFAYAIDAGSQVGVGLKAAAAHALLWRGHASGAVDLNPVGFVESYATSVNGARQVGYAVGPDLSAHALVWFGGPAAYFDLQKLLPPFLTQSYAMSIDAEGDIGGYATEADGTPHAVVWRPVPDEQASAGKMAADDR